MEEIMKNTTLLIMAAGLGSRYGGNKQIDGIGPHGEILMQYSIYDAIRAGFNKIVFIIKPEHQAIIDNFCKDIKGVEISSVYQDFSSIPSFYSIPADRVKPFGTVHAVLCARDVIKEPFAVLNADDFYGRDAFTVIHGQLTSLKDGEALSVAYRLKNTVSPNGAVTRGICDTSDGILRKVRETYKISVDQNGSIYDADMGALDGESLVSMNLWGFTPKIFEDMGEKFSEFLRTIEPENIKAEYALPTMIDGLISEGRLNVRVLSTNERWFGMTYIEDRPTVARSLEEKHKSGEYPQKLF